MGTEIPGDARNEEVRPETQYPASAEEQGEPGHARRRGEGVQEEHGISSGQSQQEVKTDFYNQT